MSLDLAPLAKKHFSLSRLLLCALPLLVLLFWILALSTLAKAGGSARATAEAPALISVPIPPAAKSASVVMLEMSIAVMRKAPDRHLGAVVRLRSSAGAALEVGRISIPENGSYQFDVRRALGQASGGSAEVEVLLIARDGGPPPAGAALSVGRAQIVTR